MNTSGIFAYQHKGHVHPKPDMRLSSSCKAWKTPNFFPERWGSRSVYLFRFDEDAGTYTPFTCCCFLFVFLVLTVFGRILFRSVSKKLRQQHCRASLPNAKNPRACNSLPRWSQDAENNLPMVFSVPFVTIHNAMKLWTVRIIKTIGAKVAAPSLFRENDFPLSLIQLQTSFLWTHRYYDRNTPNTRNGLTARFFEGAFPKTEKSPLPQQTVKGAIKYI